MAIDSGINDNKKTAFFFTVFENTTMKTDETKECKFEVVGFMEEGDEDMTSKLFSKIITPNVL